MTTPSTERLLATVRCGRCKGLGVLVVDRGLHMINCPDCHPSYAEIRKRQAAALRSLAEEGEGE